MIREATPKDMPALVEMGEHFHAASPFSGRVAFDARSFGVSLSRQMAAPLGVVLVADELGLVGFTTGLVYPCWFNARAALGQEIAWWVEPDARGDTAHELRAELECWMRDAGAGHALMSSLADDRAASMARLYRRSGYDPAENTFIKEL